MYKLIFLLGVLVCVSNNLNAQETETKLSTIALNVVAAEATDEINANQMEKLSNKITSIVTESGLASTNYVSGFIIIPKLEIYDRQRTQGGMRNLSVIDCNLSLFIKQTGSNTVFSSFNKRLQGSGFNNDEAIANAISQINPGDAAISAFINKAKEKIITYYNQNCSIILQKAQKERTIKNYEAAMFILLSIPEEASGCYGQAQSKAVTLFKELQQYNCKKYLQDARNFAAGNNYDEALRRLSWIDPTVSCGTEAKALLNNISKEVDADKKKEWDLVFKIYEGRIEIAKAQAQAMNSLTTAWLLGQPRSGGTVIIR